MLKFQDATYVSFSYPGHVLASVHCIPGREGNWIFGFRLREAYDPGLHPVD